MQETAQDAQLQVRAERMAGAACLLALCGRMRGHGCLSPDQNKCSSTACVQQKDQGANEKCSLLSHRDENKVWVRNTNTRHSPQSSAGKHRSTSADSTVQRGGSLTSPVTLTSDLPLERPPVTLTSDLPLERPPMTLTSELLLEHPPVTLTSDLFLKCPPMTQTSDLMLEHSSMTLASV